MANPKFSLGQAVTYARPTLITPDGSYLVVRIFPQEGLDRRYSIKRDDEPYERVASERELANGGGSHAPPAVRQSRR
jgi:hypothetical protein